MIMAEVDVDEKTLQAIADETGGKFYRATDTDSLQKIYEEINRFEKTAQTVQKFEHVEELYPWALIPALGHSGIQLAAAANPVAEIAVRFGRPCVAAGGTAVRLLVLIWMWRRYDARQHAALAQVRLAASAASIDPVDVGRAAPRCSGACSSARCLPVRGARGSAGRVSLGTSQPPRQRHRVRDRHLAQHADSRCEAQSVDARETRDRRLSQATWTAMRSGSWHLRAARFWPAR